MSMKYHEVGGLPDSAAIAIFRVAIIFLVLSQLAWFFLPLGVLFESNNDIAAAYAGVGSMLSEDFTLISSAAFTGLYIFFYAGLFSFKRWSRLALLFLAISSLPVIALGGLSVQSGLQGSLGYCMTISEGFVVGFSFHPAINRMMHKR